MTTTLEPTGTTPQTTSSLLPRAAVAGVAAFLLASLVAGFLDPGYSPVSEAISALASTQSEAAGVMIAGFLLGGLGLLAAGSTLWRTSRAAGLGTAAAGVLLAVDGLLRQSCSSLQQACADRESAGDVSGAHVAHDLVALVLFVLLAAVAYVLARRLRSRWVLWAAVAETLLVVWFGSGAYGEYGGLVQRALVLLAFGLPAYAAARRAQGTPRACGSSPRGASAAQAAR
jgi:hypothetical membrane protein